MDLEYIVQDRSWYKNESKGKRNDERHQLYLLSLTGRSHL